MTSGAQFVERHLFEILIGQAPGFGSASGDIFARDSLNLVSSASSSLDLGR
jgi:hypothetical protein